MPEPESNVQAPSAREGLIACCLALLLGVMVVGRPAWDGDWIYLATDTASVQAPWSATDAARNPQLSDSGVAFYPHYRKVSERWRRGELPLWNPDLYAGVPLLANPQWGVLDPQVAVLVLLDALGGQTLFDWGFALLAVMRIAAAALGTYLLARTLALSRSAAALAGVGYALSGSVILWLGYSLSHVTPCLPWVILGIEWIRREQRPFKGWITTTLALALAIYGGHPEVAFFVGLSGGIWALSLLDGEARRVRCALLALLCGVLLAAPILAPFVEYLSNSGALLAHQLAPSERRTPDFLGLGAVLLLVGFVTVWRRGVLDSAGPRKLVQTLAMACVLLGFLWLGSVRGAQVDLGLSAVLSIEAGSALFGIPILLLAVSAALGGAGGLAPRRFILALALFGWALAVSFPGVVDLWRWIPLVGLAAPARSACCAALFLSLLAGYGLQHAARTERLTAGLGLALFGFVGWFAGGADLPASVALDTEGTVVTYDRLPSLTAEDGGSGLAGQLHGGLRPDHVTLQFVKLGEQDRVLEVSSFVSFAQLGVQDSNGMQSFDFGDLDLRALGPGLWRLRLEFLREGKRLGSRFPAVVQNPERGAPEWIALACGALAVLVLAFPLNAGSRWFVVLLALIPGWRLGHSWNPAVPLEEHLFESQTERFLAREFPTERFLAAPGILPADTALLAGLATIDGYDALDVASFDGYRAFAMKPGRNPLLHWSADGIDLESAAFRLFGVRVLLLHVARELPGWTLVAGPQGAPNETEVFVYRAEVALPRAYCVNQVVPMAEVLAAPQDFDPERSAFLENTLSYEIAKPFVDSRVKETMRTAERLEFEVELDGEGLFLCTEQYFPGWQLWVDDEPREILRVDSIFRGVFLKAGTHRLRFEYEPESWERGKRLGWLGLLLFSFGCIYTGRRSRWLLP